MSNEVKEGGNILYPEPIKTPLEIILEIVSKEVKNEKKAIRLSEEIFKASEELKLVKFFAEEELATVVKREFGGAVLLRISNYPERNDLEFDAATVANVREYSERTRKENRLAFLKKQLEDKTGISVSEYPVPEILINSLTKNR